MYINILFEKKKRFRLLLVPNGAGLNGVGVEKVVAPNIEGAVPNFRFA